MAYWDRFKRGWLNWPFFKARPLKVRWQGEGLLLAVRKYGESSALLDVFTMYLGRRVGLLRGAFNKQNKSVIQPGNQLFLTWNSRIEESLGAFKVELIKFYSKMKPRLHLGIDCSSIFLPNWPPWRLLRASWLPPGGLLGRLGGILAASWGVLGGSWEALGNILEGFGSCFGPNLQLGKHLRSDLLKYRKTVKNNAMHCKNEGWAGYKIDEKSTWRASWDQFGRQVGLSERELELRGASWRYLED